MNYKQMKIKVLNAVQKQVLTVSELVIATGLTKHELLLTRAILKVEGKIGETSAPYNRSLTWVYRVPADYEKAELMELVEYTGMGYYEDPRSYCVYQEIMRDGLITYDRFTGKHRLTSDAERNLIGLRREGKSDGEIIQLYLKLLREAVSVRKLIAGLARAA